MARGVGKLLRVVVVCALANVGMVPLLLLSDQGPVTVRVKLYLVAPGVFQLVIGLFTLEAALRRACCRFYVVLLLNVIGWVAAAASVVLTSVLLASQLVCCSASSWDIPLLTDFVRQGLDSYYDPLLASCSLRIVASCAGSGYAAGKWVVPLAALCSLVILSTSSLIFGVALAGRQAASRDDVWYNDFISTHQTGNGGNDAPYAQSIQLHDHVPSPVRHVGLPGLPMPGTSGMETTNASPYYITPSGNNVVDSPRNGAVSNYQNPMANEVDHVHNGGRGVYGVQVSCQASRPPPRHLRCDLL